MATAIAFKLADSESRYDHLYPSPTIEVSDDAEMIRFDDGDMIHHLHGEQVSFWKSTELKNEEDHWLYVNIEFKDGRTAKSGWLFCENYCYNNYGALDHLEGCDCVTCKECAR